MTSPGRYAASDGSFAKSAGSAAARGGILIAIAIVIGFALLAFGFDGGDSDAAGPVAPTDPEASTDESPDPTDSVDPGDGSTEESIPPEETVEGGDEGGDPTTSEPVVVDDPSTISVAVLNGTGEPGLASARGETLGALNYTWLAGNAASSPITESKVYFASGFGDEAGVLAAALSGPASVLELAPDDPATLESGTQAAAGSADIIVVLGTDNALQ